MGHSRAAGDDDRSPRLFLAVPPLADGREAVLAEVLAGADIAAVLLQLAPADERTLIRQVKALAPVIQRAGTAVVLEGHPEIVARAGADGAQLAGPEAFEAARATLKPDRIAGAAGLVTRHDAMVAAETGADYVLFGEPDGDGRRPPFEATVERIGWWAEVFEMPCVGFAADLDEAAALAAAGADFVMLGDFVFAHGAAAPAIVREALARIAALEPAR
jgi:thiamine-phosphate pyrophosphorylase